MEFTEVTITREHEIACGHRVVGHEGKCQHLHGHNYLISFTCSAPKLDRVGRVIDFGVIKSILCQWLEDNWDHKFLAWQEDDRLAGAIAGSEFMALLEESIVWLPFNPTAENIATYLLQVIGPKQLEGTGVKLTSVVVGETRKCSATASRV